MTSTGFFSADVLALDFFNGRTAVLQRWDVEARKWRDVARTKLRRNGSAVELGRSSGVFRAAVHGKLRAVLHAALGRAVLHDRLQPEPARLIYLRRPDESGNARSPRPSDRATSITAGSAVATAPSSRAAASKKQSARESGRRRRS
jgi:hypothetical protein